MTVEMSLTSNCHKIFENQPIRSLYPMNTKAILEYECKNKTRNLNDCSPFHKNSYEKKLLQV